jgi:hypothetical protein
MKQTLKSYLGGLVGAGVAYGLVSFSSIEIALIFVAALAGFAFVSAEIAGEANRQLVDLLDQDGFFDRAKQLK